MLRRSSESHWDPLKQVLQSQDQAIIGRAGEHLVAFELAARGWEVMRPPADCGVDLAAVRVRDQELDSALLQVKCARWTDASKYTIRIRREKLFGAANFWLAFVLLGPSADDVRFLMMSPNEWRQTMGQALETKSWLEEGAYTFHVPLGLGKWALYGDRFDDVGTRRGQPADERQASHS